VIRGLSIGDGTGTPQKVYLEVDSDKNCYVVLPNGTLLTSTSGVVNYNWEGIAGAVRLIVPKDTAVIFTKEIGVGGSDFIGELTTTNSGSLDFGFNQLTKITATNANIVAATNNMGLTDFSAENATQIYLSACALTDKSIGDFLIAASVNNPTANGSADFSGVTNPLVANICGYMYSIGVIEIPTPPALSAWITANLSTWSLTFRSV